MTVAPLYTAAELEERITALKAAELALMSGVVEYTLDMGGHRRQVRYRDLEEIRTHLRYFQGEKIKLSVGNGPQVFAGRVRRG